MKSAKLEIPLHMLELVGLEEMKTYKVDFTNYMNLQYEGPLYIGSQKSKMKFIYDTGSSWLWVPITQCSGCPTNNLFDTSKSRTLLDLGESKELFYGRGYVNGTVV